MKTIKPKTINSCWSKRYPDVGMISQNLQGNHERDHGYGKKKAGWGRVGEGFQDTDLGKLQELLDTTLEELTEDDLMEASASEPVPDEEEDVEEAVPENKLT